MKIAALVSIDVISGSEDLAEHALAHRAPLSLWAIAPGGPVLLVAVNAFILGTVSRVIA